LKVNDPFKGESKLFESMTHTHSKGIPNDKRDPDCARCKAEFAESSIPKKDFQVKDHKGKSITISEITLTRGRYDDCIGWSF